MAAICAYCEQPIVRGQDVAVLGTEILHRTCAISRPGLTVLQVTRRDLALAHAEGARLRSQWRDTERARVDAEQRLLELKTAQRDLETQLVRVTEQRDASRRQVDGMVAVTRRAQPPAVVTPEAPPTEDAHDGRDDAEIRFSLLDLG